MNRREFLLGSAAVAGLAGCKAVNMCGNGCCAAGAAPMRNFKVAPMAKIRVGVVGLGSRGLAAAVRLIKVPGVEVAAICDVRQTCVDKTLAALSKAGVARPQVFGGAVDAWKGLCDSAQVDVVYNATPWHLHAPIGVYAMQANKHVLIEVPAATSVDECWQLVETAEATKRHCMQLENCCYGENELLALNLCKLGMLGELIHGEGGYVHDRRWQIFNDDQWERWRNHWNEQHAGNYYSTHGLGPISLDMGINRGDRYDYLVSMDGVQCGYEAFARNTLKDGNPLKYERFRMADMNVTLIRTMKGRTIMLQHDVTSPRQYSRLNLIAGTKGVLRSYPRRDIFIEGANEWPKDDGGHKFTEAMTEKIRQEYMHPLYKLAGEISKKVGGHGGMDYLMDLRWAYCLQQGMPLDTDVYDLASWCAISELTEISSTNRSRQLDVPDFTRGVWEQPCECNLMSATIDFKKLKFDESKLNSAEGQLNV